MREGAELVLNASPPFTELSAGGAAGADRGERRKGQREKRGRAGQAPLGGSQVLPPSSGAREAWAGTGVAFCSVGQWGCARL